MISGPEDGKSIDRSGFEGLERSTGIEDFRLDDDSRHRLEWALFWARTGQNKKTKVDITNLVIELAVQYARAGNRSVLGPKIAATGKDSVAKSFLAFVKSALAFVPETGRL